VLYIGYLYIIIADDEIDILIESNKDQRRRFSWVGGLLFLLVEP
jgi:hypothetical protein